MNVNEVVWLTLMGTVFLTSGITLLSVWSRKDTWLRLTVICVFLLTVPAVTVISSEMLGWHKPIAIAWRLHGLPLRVVNWKFIKDRGIYLYVDMGGEPRAIVYPWDEDMAKKMQEAINESRRRGERGFMLRYQPGVSGEENIWGLPQPMAPIPKTREPVVAPYERV